MLIWMDDGLTDHQSEAIAEWRWCENLWKYLHLTLFYKNKLVLTNDWFIYSYNVGCVISVHAGASILDSEKICCLFVCVSPPLHCNHWFTPAGYHGWPSYVSLVARFDGWNQMSFFGHVIALSAFSHSLSCSAYQPQPSTHFLIFLFLPLSEFLSQLLRILILSCLSSPFRTRMWYFLISFLQKIVQKGIFTAQTNKSIKKKLQKLFRHLMSVSLTFGCH